ncbi:hypothetical protein QO004_004128 [Rhizobium mesoamericanum]|nr:hypothetical protein [Rhizobium mesoamericanum]
MNSVKPVDTREISFTPEDLRLCNAALKAVSRASNVEKDALAVSRLALVIIELRKRGVQDVEQLTSLAGEIFENPGSNDDSPAVNDVS